MWESPSSSTGLEHRAIEIRFTSLARITTKKIHVKSTLPRVLLNVASPHEDAHGQEERTTRPQPAPTVPLVRSYGFACFKSAVGRFSGRYILDGNTSWSWHWEQETAPSCSAEPACAPLL